MRPTINWVGDKLLLLIFCVAVVSVLLFICIYFKYGGEFLVTMFIVGNIYLYITNRNK